MFLAQSHPDPLPPTSSVGGVDGDSETREDAATSWHRFKGNKDMARQAMKPGAPDIHLDTATLHMLQHGTLHGTTVTPAQVSRVKRRVQQYRIVHAPSGKELRRVMSNGSTRVVPKPESRAAIIQAAHDTCGHFGVRRTLHLLLQTYWWSGILRDVANELRQCELCDRAKASFTGKNPQRVDVR